MSSVAAVVVNYRSEAFAARAVEALRRDAAASALELECLLIDNGSDEAGAARLRGTGAEVIAPPRNLGYGGALNLGVARSRAAAILMMNADVEVRPGCLAALLGALARGAAAAGPRFEWDEAGRFLLPPLERRDFASEALARLARRGERWAARARRRWRRHAQRHWRAPAEFESSALSGALLAVDRAAWERVGGFDEGFFLFFEENDWLLRLRGAGLRAVHEPRARARHAVGASLGDEPRAGEWFERSRRRFETRHRGALARRVLALLERLPAAPAAAAPHLPLPVVGPEDWIELSTSPSGVPAAAEPPRPREGGAWSPPPLGAGDPTWYLRRLDGSGREREWTRLTA